MSKLSFFAYWRLKGLAMLARAIVSVISFFPLRRERLLCKDVHPQRVRIPSRDQGRYIEADLYYPPGLSPSSPPAARPVLLNWHGSGFIIPTLGSDLFFCSRVARETGMLVLDVDYRKAPENPFPAAVHDVEDALRWVAAQPDRFDLARVAVSGFSAGGNLALVAASAVRKTLQGLSIPVVVAVYPVTDVTIAPEAKTVPHPRKPLTPFVAHLFNDCYVPDKATRADPRVSPSLADPADFPSTVVILTCDGDVLAPEANELARKLDDGHRKVINETFKAVPHGFDKGPKKGTYDWDQREIAYTSVVEALKEALSL